MNNFDKTVPFDPGFSKISYSFIGNIQAATQEYNHLKAPHQKKFWLTKFENTLIDFINKSSAFYLGCIIWGSFIHYRFKNNPKKISGSNTDGLSKEELKDFDCAVEAKAMLEYIDSFNRDCKYFLKRPSRISKSIVEILTNYIEFAKINNNFIGIKTTADVKIPAAFKHFEKLAEKELDGICEKIYATIKEEKIEKLLELRY